VYPRDNRKPLEVFLDFSWNMQSLGFLKEVSGGARRVNSWGRENEVRVTKQVQAAGQEKRRQKGQSRVQVHFRSATTKTQ